MKSSFVLCAALARRRTAVNDARCMSEPNCKDSGVLVPVIDRNRCEGKADCERVCPYHVFEIGKLDTDTRRALSVVGRVKAFAHGYRQAFAVRADQCHGCGLCVTACPEHAIKLAAADRAP
jgi:4Fe-4S ferredoxin